MLPGEEMEHLEREILLEAAGSWFQVYHWLHPVDLNHYRSLSRSFPGRFQVLSQSTIFFGRLPDHDSFERNKAPVMLSLFFNDYFSTKVDESSSRPMPYWRKDICFITTFECPILYFFPPPSHFVMLINVV
ncbi:hypothetical protein HJC23_006709 [Cyclotella cryptica]|uniref:Uncharacterized protein n=1 Tax=Cyclotella cryptica TaxID=29204 RepID=A0ABD3P0E8_9STRA